MTQQQPNIPPLAALVYRSGKGCRQYAFESADDLATWAARHPYKNEQLRVMPVKDRKVLGDRWMPAAEAADFVRTAQGLTAGVMPIKEKEMEWVDVATLTVRREFRHGTYEFADGTKAPSLELKRDCGLGCTCEAVIITKAPPSPALAEDKCLCFNDLKKQGVSEVKGTAKAIKEGPDEWIYEVQAKLVEARQNADQTAPQPPTPTSPHDAGFFTPIY